MALERYIRMHKASDLGVTTQFRYETLLDEAATLRLTKVNGYGEHRYTMDDVQESKELCMSDITRKYLRIREYMVRGAQGESVRQNLLDLANYAIMAIQVGEKEGWVDEES